MVQTALGPSTVICLVAFAIIAHACDGIHAVGLLLMWLPWGNCCVVRWC